MKHGRARAREPAMAQERVGRDGPERVSRAAAGELRSRQACKLLHVHIVAAFLRSKNYNATDDGQAVARDHGEGPCISRKECTKLEPSRVLEQLRVMGRTSHRRRYFYIGKLPPPRPAPRSDTWLLVVVINLLRDRFVRRKGAVRAATARGKVDVLVLVSQRRDIVPVVGGRVRRLGDQRRRGRSRGERRVLERSLRGRRSGALAGCDRRVSLIAIVETQGGFDGRDRTAVQ